MRPNAHLTAAVTAAAAACFFTETAAGSVVAKAEVSMSKWMASSIMSRRQGIMTGKGGTSELLQAGITQKAFLALVAQYPDAADVEAYIEESAASVVPYVSNASHAALSYPMDRLSNGMALLQLSSPSPSSPANSTAQAAFARAADALRRSIDLNRRNPEGGLWYFTYPQWSYLDGMYSLAPFYTLYTATKTAAEAAADPAAAELALADMYYQVDLLWQRTRDAASGLLAHGYDASRTAVWADPATGASPHVWDRALGWYLMALVDTVELLDAASADAAGAAGAVYSGLLAQKFQQLARAVLDAADPASGAWWQVMDRPGADGNYIESSGSAMFAYALLKGARLGYLDCPDAAVDVATRAHDYLTRTFVVHESESVLGYNGTVSVCSLNSTASYEYYVTRPIEYNNVLGSNAYILASLEVERLRQ
ncbi:hypothetical protein SLS62_003668 [Diatrype stigma]|uniref:Uncharacterized protein n=1 Tax=Diatrype stigma TaxID=117547 RepID=A0AAN9UY33_9PEZI